MFITILDLIFVHLESLLFYGSVIGILMVVLSIWMAEKLAYSSVLRFLGGLLLLVLAWIALFWLMGAFTGRLAPWDSFPPPPQGTWVRQLNDFFDEHEFLPATIIVSFSMVVFLAGMARAANREVRSWLPLTLAVVHVGFFLFDGIAIWLADYLTTLWLPPPRTIKDAVGYHWTGLSIVVTCVLLGVFFWGQIKVTSVLSSHMTESGGTVS